MDLLKKIFIFISLFIFVGCTKNVTTLQLKPTKQTTEIKEYENSKVEANNKKVIVYAGSMEQSAQMLLIIDEYNKQQDDILVRYEELPFSKQKRYEEIDATLYNEDTVFDIIEIDLTWVSEFANKKYLYPLDNYIKNEQFDMNAYIKNSVSSVTFENNIYALPKSISTPMMYYKKDKELLPCKTWDDIINYYQTSEKPSDIKYTYIFQVKPSEELVKEALEVIYSYGGEIFDNDFNILLKKESTIKALNKFYEIYHLDFVSEDLQLNSLEDVSIKFSEGNSIFMRNYYNNIINMKNLGVTTLPMGDNGLVTVLEGTANIINNYSENKDAAWDFLKFSTGFKAQKRLAIQSHQIPSLLALYTEKDVIFANPYFEEKPFINAINNAIEPIKTTEYNKIIKIFQDELTKFLNGEKSAEEMITDFEIRLKN